MISLVIIVIISLMVLFKSSVGSFWTSVFEILTIFLPLVIGFLIKPKTEATESKIHATRIATEIYDVISEIPSRTLELDGIKAKNIREQANGRISSNDLLKIDYRIEREKLFLNDVERRLKTTLFSLKNIAPDFVEGVNQEQEATRKIMEEMDKGVI